MVIEDPVQQIIRFSTFEFDPRSCELRKHGIRVKVQEQPLRLLVILLERPGEIVSREELQKRLWPDNTFVEFDRGLNTAIKKLRQALDDSAATPRFVETVHRRGYRFIGPLQKTGEQEPPPPAPAAKPADSGGRFNLRIALVLLAVHVILTVAIFWVVRNYL